MAKPWPALEAKRETHGLSDVQVLHGFATVEDAQAYLSSEMFIQHVVTALQPYLNTAPDVRIYKAA
ncbi:hypothetical protein FH608_016970 [Nonomuraea phyllanthi]|uniref:Uncharacterized protein n=1 Tax=Nonomuraea phyllanthi TaxID=2219224 RepID=A0A5C4WMG7_9ACTN|nr:hypothetical protein [Nonomuraea phyllanthi]KAB8194848.1 hypothetical protein FH608_016970 [Nonomuraea phyllanthi]